MPNTDRDPLHEVRESNPEDKSCPFSSAQEDHLAQTNKGVGGHVADDRLVTVTAALPTPLPLTPPVPTSTHHHQHQNPTGTPTPLAPLTPSTPTPGAGPITSPADLAERLLPALKKYVAGPHREHLIPHTFPARWRQWSTLDKFLAAGDLAERSKGVAVTLHLGDKQHRAASDHLDPLAYVMKRVNAALRAHNLSGLPLALALGLSATNRLHAHVIVIPGPHDRGVIVKALRAAGGRVPSERAARQLTSRRIYHGVAVAEYALNMFDARGHAEERRSLEKHFPGADHYSLSRSMNALVRATQEAARN